ncbi:MAG: response regulator, partial [Verrucomicrobiota bacterium]
MSRICILSVEDEPEVRQAITRDLEPFERLFRIEAAEDVEDAYEVIKSVEADGDEVGLILCDHRLPGTTGVEFLVELQGREEYRHTRKVLVTGQADQQDTIRAINTGGLDHYVAKPWQAATLQDIVKGQLTEFILVSDLDPMPF